MPQSDYNAIASGNNGYTAGAGYNLVTGLGTPLANLLVPDLVAYHGPGTTYGGPTVGPLQNASLVTTGASAGCPIDVFGVFDSLTVASYGLGGAQSQLPSTDISSPRYETPAPAVAGQASASSLIAVGFASGTSMNLSAAGLMPLPPARATVAAASSGVMSRLCTLSVLGRAAGSDAERPSPAPPRRAWERGSREHVRFSINQRNVNVTDFVLDELVSDPTERSGDRPVPVWEGTIGAAGHGLGGSR